MCVQVLVLNGVEGAQEALFDNLTTYSCIQYECLIMTSYIVLDSTSHVHFHPYILVCKNPWSKCLEAFRSLMLVHLSPGGHQQQGSSEQNPSCKSGIYAFPALDGCRKPAALTLVCPSMTVRGTLVEGHLFLGGKGLSQFHKTTIWKGKAQGDG